jgi:hypothetical protein
MPAPVSATALVFPDWTDLTDTWREIDAEWLRNRSVNILADAAARTAAITAPLKGMIAPVQSGTGAPDFFNGAAWESVRYPNLDVISDGTSATLRRTGASPATGIQLVNDGSVNIAKGFLGTGGIGSTLDNTGIAIKVGAKTVKLATNATQLTVDSPVLITGAVNVTGAVTATGAVQGATVTGTTSITGGTVAGTTGTFSAALQGLIVQAGTVQLNGNQVKATAGTAALTLAADSTVTLAGTGLTINPPTTLASTVAITGVATFAAQPVLSIPTFLAGIKLAGLIVVAGNVAPTQNAPDGTIYFTY